MFLGEVLTNAVRHGAPGSAPRVSIAGDPVRREMHVRVENRVRDGMTTSPSGDAYGGLAILEALARLFDWRDLTFNVSAGIFTAEWRIPASVKTGSGQPD
jgi:two-component sensor histidine kinase